jgi:hypothetical protein
MATYVVQPLGPWIGRPADARRPAKFRSTWTDTLNLLDRELDWLNVRRFVLQIDVSAEWIRLDGQLHARARVALPAVRITFTSRHGDLAYATDMFLKWQDNVRAIALSLEALRAVDRYGVTGRGEQYRGFTAIAAAPSVMTAEQAAGLICEWAADPARFAPYGILADPDLLNRAMKHAARRAHPDSATGHADTMARLTEARALLDRLQRTPD